MLIWLVAVITILTAIGTAVTWRSFRHCGTIEGILLVDGQPAPEGTLVICEIAEHQLHKNSSFTITCHNVYAQTTEGGRFLFNRIRAGEVSLGRSRGPMKQRSSCGGLFKIYDEEPSLLDYEQLAVVTAHASVRVVLGEGCRTVQGRLTFPENLMPSEGAAPSFSAWLWGDADAPVAPEHCDWAGRAALWKEASMTTEGIEWREAVSRRYHVTPDSRGIFMVRHVKPGRYVLRVTTDFHPEAECDEHQMSYEGTTEPFHVPAAGSTEDVSAVHLGDLLVFLREQS